MIPVEFGEGCIIAKQFDPTNYTMIVKSGAIDLFLPMPGSKTVFKVDTLGPGSALNVMNQLHTEEHLRYYGFKVVAATHC